MCYRTFLFIALAMALPRGVTARNDIEPDKEFYTALRTSKPIVVDGSLSEWSGAPVLADPKFAFEIAQELPKSNAVHPIYGHVLILNRQTGGHWMTVRYDAEKKKAVLDKEFRLADCAGY